MSATVTVIPQFDVFLNFRGIDTRRNLISFLYRDLLRRKIRTFKDDKELESGQKFSPELIRAIEGSKFAVVVVSVNYAASPWCLDELVKIMELENKDLIKVFPIFYGVDPSDVRRQIGKVAEQFKKHEGREDQDLEKVLSWRQALTNLANISGDCSLKWEDDSKMVDEITERISKELKIAKPRRGGSKLVGIDAHMKAIRRKLNLKSKESVRVFGIWARGGNGRSALAKFVYENISQNFESHCFLESVKRICQEDRHMSDLHEDFLIRTQGESLSKSMLKNQKVLLVVDDVSKLEQFDALAEDFNNFGPGSIVIITTQDKLLLDSANIKGRRVYEVELLRFHELRRQSRFKERDISAEFDLSLYRV
ncbi:Toll/interleukin-1 receptor-like protein [Cardamine amara subsp. amara]|uniref:Toll/interleukin-1 receptor-like protein n=1 Tax=Cardamine amara subsp. amara TaxID=228776 RepID=A0ABD1BKB6_CARAN